MTIYTHSGVFHGDDVMATAIIQEITGGNQPVKRVRELPESFNPDVDVAVDVGGEHSPEKRIFDHHFRGGNDDSLAAAGKVWSHFGTDLCGGDVADRVYETLIGSIDRADIGISDWKAVDDSMRHLSAAGLISSMNPPVGSSENDAIAAFAVATAAAQTALRGAVSQAKAWVEMRDAVSEAAKVRPRPEIMVLDQPGPWQEHVVLESQLEDVLYVIYPDTGRGGYRLQAVPDKPGSFGMRKALPESWKGLRGAELNEKLGGEFTESDSLFCHPGLFMAGASSKKEAIAMAEMAI